jgi:hypothetical protein
VACPLVGRPMVENGFALIEKGVRQADTPRKTAKLNKYAIALSFRWFHIVEEKIPPWCFKTISSFSTLNAFSIIFSCKIKGGFDYGTF